LLISQKSSSEKSDFTRLKKMKKWLPSKILNCLKGCREDLSRTIKCFKPLSRPFRKIGKLLFLLEKKDPEKALQVRKNLKRMGVTAWTCMGSALFFNLIGFPYHAFFMNLMFIVVFLSLAFQLVKGLFS